MKFTKKILTENLFLSSDGPKFFTKGTKQSVMISEDQLDRLLSVVKKDINIRELDGIIKEANVLIRSAILKENLSLSIGDYQTITEDVEEGATYDLEEQGQYNRNPGVAAAEGIENILDGIKKAYDMIKDSETRKKLANSMTKLGNFMTITADAIGAGRDQRQPVSSDSLRKTLPYPELDEIDNGEYKLTKEGSCDAEDIEEGPKPDFLDLDGDGNTKESMKKAANESQKEKENLINEDIEKMKQIIQPIKKV